MLTPFPEAIGFSSSRFRLGMTLSTTTVSIRGDGCAALPLVLEELEEYVELSRASLLSLGLCRWALMGPPIECRIPPRMLLLVVFSLGVCAAAPLSPLCCDCERFAGDQDLLLLWASLPFGVRESEVELAMTERRKRLAFSRVPASLTLIDGFRLSLKG